MHYLTSITQKSKISKKFITRTSTVLFVVSIFVAVLAISEAVVKLSAGSRPPLSDGSALIAYMSAAGVPILTVVLIDTLLMAALVVFFTGLRFFIKQRSKVSEWATDVGLGSIVLYAAITLIGDSMDGGTVLNTTISKGDQTVIRTLIESHTLLFGPIGSVCIVFTVGAFAFALARTKSVPAWVTIMGYVVAAVNMIAIPEVFHRIGEVAFGTQVTLGALGLFIAWVLVLGCSIFYRSRRAIYNYK